MATAKTAPKASIGHRKVLILVYQETPNRVYDGPTIANFVKSQLAWTSCEALGQWPEQDAPLMIRSALHDLTVSHEQE